MIEPIRGRCACGNMEIHWSCPDEDLTPRACQCDYCRSKQAAYVSRPGTGFEVHIAQSDEHVIRYQGSKSAEFHECSGCGMVVFVTAMISGQRYGALSAQCFPEFVDATRAIKTTFYSQSAEEKRRRWRQSWCHPVVVNNGSREFSISLGADKEA